VPSGLLGRPASRPEFDRSLHLHGIILVRNSGSARTCVVWTFWIENVRFADGARQPRIITSVRNNWRKQQTR
jgi:hypothetical protein